MFGTHSVLRFAGKFQIKIILTENWEKISTLNFHFRSDFSFSTFHRKPNHQSAKHYSANMTYNFVDPKTVLWSAKSQTWKYFKFCVAGNDIDQSCPLFTLPWERPPEETERNNQILYWHNKSHQLSEILSQWTWSCEQLDLSVINNDDSLCGWFSHWLN